MKILGLPVRMLLIILAGALFGRAMIFSFSNDFDPGTIGHLEKVVCATINLVGSCIMIGLASLHQYPTQPVALSDENKGCYLIARRSRLPCWFSRSPS